MLWRQCFRPPPPSPPLPPSHPHEVRIKAAWTAGQCGTAGNRPNFAGLDSFSEVFAVCVKLSFCFRSSDTHHLHNSEISFQTLASVCKSVGRLLMARSEDRLFPADSRGSPSGLGLCCFRGAHGGDAAGSRAADGQPARCHR